MTEWNARAYNRLNNPMQTWGEAGFVDVETNQFEAPVQLGSREETFEYFEHVILGSHLERIPDPRLRMQFVKAMTQQSATDDPPFRQDYWRVNLRARRPDA